MVDHRVLSHPQWPRLAGFVILALALTVAAVGGSRPIPARADGPVTFYTLYARDFQGVVVNGQGYDGWRKLQAVQILKSCSSGPV